MIAEMGSISGSRVSLAARIFKYWLPVAIMLAAMYYFSTDRLSNDTTETVVGKLLMWLSSHMSPVVIATANFTVRKAAHFIEYAALGGLLFRAFRADDPRRWRFRWVAYSLIAAASWAALDEFHQTFTRTRSGSPLDSLLDSSGALFMLLVITFYTRRTRVATLTSGPGVISKGNLTKTT
jgi:VanZ family protein